MVEFALVFLCFLLLVLGLMEMGRAVWAYTTVAHAARQGARYAMAHGSADDRNKQAVRMSVADVVETYAFGLDKSKLKVKTSWDADFDDIDGGPPTRERGATVAVRVRYDFNLVVTKLILPDATFPIGATSRMIIAN
jgi:Flp pilus assembly protein TadG